MIFLIKILLHAKHLPQTSQPAGFPPMNCRQCDRIDKYRDRAEYSVSGRRVNSRIFRNTMGVELLQIQTASDKYAKSMEVNA